VLRRGEEMMEEERLEEGRKGSREGKERALISRQCWRSRYLVGAQEMEGIESRRDDKEEEYTGKAVPSFQ
jgi:hypothetical protein